VPDLLLPELLGLLPEWLWRSLLAAALLPLAAMLPASLPLLLLVFSAACLLVAAAADRPCGSLLLSCPSLLVELADVARVLCTPRDEAL
jgi:hypothetical protein